MYWIIIHPKWTCSMKLIRCKEPCNIQIIKRFQFKNQRALEHSPCYITSFSPRLKFAYHLSNMESEDLQRLVTNTSFRTTTTHNTCLWKWIITITKLEKWYPNFFNTQGSVQCKYIPIYIQKDATLHILFISGNCSTCFEWYLHPSSGAHTTLSTASGNCQTVAATCRYRGRVGTSFDNYQML